MAERQVTVDGVTHPLADPFLLIATQNSIEQEGTFPLPEAQLDRFIVRTSLGYPDARGGAGDRRRAAARAPDRRSRPVVALDELAILFEARRGGLHRPAAQAMGGRARPRDARLDLVEVGASVRGSLALERMARALALVLGRDYVVAEDIERLFPLVVMHRMVATADVIMEGLSGDELADRVWQACLARAPRPEPTWDAEAATAEA